MDRNLEHLNCLNSSYFKGFQTFNHPCITVWSLMSLPSRELSTLANKQAALLIDLRRIFLCKTILGFLGSIFRTRNCNRTSYNLLFWPLPKPYNLGHNSKYAGLAASQYMYYGYCTNAGDRRRVNNSVCWRFFSSPKHAPFSP